MSKSNIISFYNEIQNCIICIIYKITAAVDRTIISMYVCITNLSITRDNDDTLLFSYVPVRKLFF